MGSEPGTLEVEVDGISVIVRDPQTDFMVIYQKRFAKPHLVLTYNWVSTNETSPTISDFRARAFQAAVAKARELGWIV